jgi:hypothetical protein
MTEFEAVSPSAVQADSKAQQAAAAYLTMTVLPLTVFYRRLTAFPRGFSAETLGQAAVRQATSSMAEELPCNFTWNSAILFIKICCGIGCCMTARRRRQEFERLKFYEILAAR